MIAFMFLVVSQHKIIVFSYILVGGVFVGGGKVGCNGSKLVKNEVDLYY